MERSIFAAVIGGFLGVVTLGSLAFVFSAPDSGPNSQPSAIPASPSTPPRPEGEWRLLDPVTYENISVFPVVASYGQDTSAFLTLEAGLASGDVVVRERGSEEMVRGRDGRPVYIPQTTTGASVNRLVLVNRSKRPLLLLAGELVSGGKQDRIISKDRIVPPDAEPFPLDVFCVEHGRWSAGSVFAAARIIVHPSVREKAAVDQKQEEVWDAVRSGTTAAAPAAAPPPPLSMAEITSAMQRDAPTQAYPKIYDSRAVGVPIENV